MWKLAEVKEESLSVRAKIDTDSVGVLIVILSVRTLIVVVCVSVNGASTGQHMLERHCRIPTRRIAHINVFKCNALEVAIAREE